MTIGAETIKEIIPKSSTNSIGEEFHYNVYRLSKYSTIEDYNCLSEDNPKVKEYIKSEQIKLKEVSDREIDIIKTVLKYNNLKELI